MDDRRIDFRPDPLGFGRAGFFHVVWQAWRAAQFEEGLGEHCLRRFDQVRGVLTAMSGNLQKGAYGKIKSGVGDFVFSLFFR